MLKSGCIVLLMLAVCRGVKLNRQKRVIGGDKYAKGEYPFHVSLWYMGENNIYTAKTPDLHHTCGGSLVEKQWVLTSATCFDDTYLLGLSNTSLWKVYLGMYAQTDAEKEAQYHRIDQIFHSPQYNLTEYYGDIALLKLDKPAILDESVGLVEWNDDPDCPKVGQDIDVIGWGQTQAEIYGLGSDVPYKATVEVASLKHCRDRYLAPEINIQFGGSLRIDHGSLCAGIPEGGVDACYGDSGSPLLEKCGNIDSQKVVGLASYGYGCAQPDFPAVYTRVSSFSDWIKDTIKDN